ncbi:MAG: cyclase family protein, partial [Gemmobacter sp.]
MPMTVNREAIYKAAAELSNWGRWGPDDQIGTLNNVAPADIVAAAGLIRRGKTFALGLALDQKIQSGLFGGRWNPIHTMLATGTDAAAGNQDVGTFLRYADDSINMPCQASTQWDALAHIFLDDKMWNGYPATLVDAKGARKNGIENYRDRCVGRGVLLDIARWKGVEMLPLGYA